MTRTRILHGVAILLAAAVFLMSSASMHSESYAQTGTPTKQGSPANRDIQTLDKNGNRIPCSKLPEAKGGVILGYIVPCVTYTIEGTTERMSAATIQMLKPTLYSFMTLVIVLFGVKILQGGGQLHTEGILLLLKIGLVIAILELIPGTFVPMFYGIMSETQEVVAGAIGPDTASLDCDVGKYKDGNTAMVWAHMDCLIGKLYGITVGSDTGPNGEKRPNMLLGASIFGLLGGFLFGGSFGAILFLAAVGVLWTMFLVVLRTVVAFLNGYLYASLMFIIAPLIVPLMLMKATSQYFDPWWKGILASILMPLIISAYAMFALLLYDKMLFEQPTPGVPDSGALLYKLFDNELVKKMQGLPRPICNLERPGNLAQRTEATGLSETQIYGSNPFLNNFVNPLLTAANNQCLGITQPTLEMTEGLDTPSNRQAFTDLFHDCVKLLALGILINLGYTNMSVLARKLVGSSSVSASLDTPGGIGTKLAGIQTSTRTAFVHAFDDENGRTTSGAEFIRKLPEIPAALGRGLSGGLGREP